MQVVRLLKGGLKGGKFLWVVLFYSLSVFGYEEQAPNPYQLNMTPGVTPLSHQIYSLHMAIFWICVVIGVGVFGVLIYSLIKHRKSKGHKPADFHSSLKIELVWAIIPFIILIVMAIPATIVLMHMEDDTRAKINIKVTGFQWKWEYEYLDYGIKFFSNLSTPPDQLSGKSPKQRWYLLEVDNPLVVPISKKIRFLVTSNDVVHSWWVPALGVKRDAIPGFIHEAWAIIEKPGIYRGQCAELCGMHHGFMPIVVDARTQKDFDRWAALHAPSNNPQAGVAATIAKHEAPPGPLEKNALMAEGEKVYQSSCSVCHQAEGVGMPPAFPAMKGSKIATGPVANHIDIVLNGKSGTAMQAFGTQLSDQQIAAVITYERNAWGNDDKKKFGSEAGGLVQPAFVASKRK